MTTGSATKLEMERLAKSESVTIKLQAKIEQLNSYVRIVTLRMNSVNFKMKLKYSKN